MTGNFAYGDEPAVLEVAKDIRAVRVNRHYFLRFPYNREASEIMSMMPGAHWDRSSGWTVSASKHDELLTVMRKIDLVIRPRVADAADYASQGTAASQQAPAQNNAQLGSARMLVRLDAGCEIGQVMLCRNKPVTIERLGRPFTADDKFAKWGKPKLVGQMVRYAYHHPSTDLEIAEWQQRVDQKSPAPDPEPSL